MFKKSTLLALAGALTLGVAMLSPVSADARGHGGGGHGGGFHGGGGMRIGGGGHGGGFRHVGGGFRHVHLRHHHHWRHWHVGYRRHFWIAPVAPVATYAVARPAVAGPCTCLTKEYTPEGAVLFKDRCTSEMAMNPPAQAAPQQTSYAPAPVYQTAPTQPAQPQQAYVPTYPGPAAAQPVQQ